jgi:hypothetical protein
MSSKTKLKKHSGYRKFNLDGLVIVLKSSSKLYNNLEFSLQILMEVRFELNGMTIIY